MKLVKMRPLVLVLDGVEKVSFFLRSFRFKHGLSKLLMDNFSRTWK